MKSFEVHWKDSKSYEIVSEENGKYYSQSMTWWEKVVIAYHREEKGYQRKNIYLCRNRQRKTKNERIKKQQKRQIKPFLCLCDKIPIESIKIENRGKI